MPAKRRYYDVVALDDAAAGSLSVTSSPGDEDSGTLTDPRAFQPDVRHLLRRASERRFKSVPRPKPPKGNLPELQNIVYTTRVKVPFWRRSIGKSFRNEVTREFIFRSREF